MNIMPYTAILQAEFFVLYNGEARTPRLAGAILITA
jgi:hypothetical protein